MAFLGIDIGTTNVTVAVHRDGCFKILNNLLGKAKTDAYVSYCNDEVFIGEESKRQLGLYPFWSFYLAKCFLSSPNSQKTATDLPFEVSVDQSDPFKTTFIDTSGNLPEPTTLRDLLLLLLKEIFSTYCAVLKVQTISAYLTKPSSLEGIAKDQLCSLAKQAGFSTVHVITETIAAAIGCFLYPLSRSTKNEHILLLNLGASGAEITLFKLNNGKQLQTLGTSCDENIRGINFDKLLIEHCVAEFRKANPSVAGPQISKGATHRLRLQCEEAKILLSTGIGTSIKVQNFVAGHDLNLQLTRETFDVITSPIIQKTLNFLMKTLISANVEKDFIKEVILVGGLSRIPSVKQHIKEFFKPTQQSFGGQSPLNEAVLGHATEVAAYGAAALAVFLDSDFGFRFWNSEKTVINIAALRTALDERKQGETVPGNEIAEKELSEPVFSNILQSDNKKFSEQNCPRSATPSHNP